MVSISGMAVSLKTDLRFPIAGQQGHGSRNIHGTFYNWVKRLRRSGCQDFPAASRSQTGGSRQEIVKIELAKPGVPDSSAPVFKAPEQFQALPEQMDAMEISSAGWSIRISNGTDPALLRLALQMLGAVPC